MILETVKKLDAAAASLSSYIGRHDAIKSHVEKLLLMRDVKYKATALHWLALDPRPLTI
jgi:hypothetical protein